MALLSLGYPLTLCSRYLELQAWLLVFTLWNELPTLSRLATCDFPLETKIQIVKKAFPELTGGLPPLCPGLPQHLVHPCLTYCHAAP